MSEPSIARISDWCLGGSMLPADEPLAARLLEISPGVPQMLRLNRRFADRAVRFAAGRGISQFLDLGCGIPFGTRTVDIEGRDAVIRGVHVTAREACPDARIACVDNDPQAVAHADAFFAGDPLTAVAEADAAQPDAVLGDPALAGLIDPGRPACVIMSLLAHFFTPDEAREMTAGWVARMAPGSVLVLSCTRSDDEGRFRAAREALGPRTRISNFTRAEVESLFGGTELVVPGVVPARAWCAGMPDAARVLPRREVYALAGAGIVP